MVIYLETGKFIQKGGVTQLRFRAFGQDILDTLYLAGVLVGTSCTQHSSQNLSLFDSVGSVAGIQIDNLEYRTNNSISSTKMIDQLKV